MVSLKFENVSLKFPLINETSRSLRFYLGNMVSRPRTSLFLPKERQALSDLNLDIKEGTRLGLIGGNGAGKTTLLRLMAGIYHPTQGHIQRSGAIVPMLDLNFGMDEEANGYENIMIASTLLGISSHNIPALTKDIQEFSELGDALNQPIKTYSSGMRMRLAFSLASSLHANILLIDEIIGVGDAHFMKKAKERVLQRIESACILVLASHVEEILRNFCNTGLVLSQGKVEFYGPIEEAISFYNNT